MLSVTVCAKKENVMGNPSSYRTIAGSKIYCNGYLQTFDKNGSYLTPTYIEKKSKNNSPETKQGCQLYMTVYSNLKRCHKNRYLIHEKRKN